MVPLGKGVAFEVCALGSDPGNLYGHTGPGDIRENVSWGGGGTDDEKIGSDSRWLQLTQLIPS